MTARNQTAQNSNSPRDSVRGEVRGKIGDQEKPFRFAAIGECMVEMVPEDMAAIFRMGFAGDVFNTAWYTKKLRPDWAMRFVSQIGSDAASDSMLHMMNDAQIDTTHIARNSTRSVGLYMISLNNGERSFSYWRDHSAARLLAENADKLAAAVQDVEMVYFSGITLAIIGAAGRETLFDVLKTARAQGKLIAFDSNLRPRLWPDADQMRRAVMQAAAHSDIVLPSYDDDAAAFGDASIQDTANRYAAQGATTVVVKNGPDAIHYICNDVSGFVMPPKAVKIVDTTSAGDSFNAGFFASMGNQLSIEDRIAAAAKIANQVIGKKGALVSLDLNDWGHAGQLNET